MVHVKWDPFIRSQTEEGNLITRERNSQDESILEFIPTVGVRDESDVVYCMQATTLAIWSQELIHFFFSAHLLIINHKVMPLFMFCWWICFAGDDHQALIWDIQQMPRAIEDPILAYTADGEINQIQWASTQPDWIGICYNNNLEILRV